MSTAEEPPVEEQRFVRSRPHVYEAYVRAQAEALWEALTTTALTPLFYPGIEVASEWQVGSPVVYRSAEGKEELGVEGTVLSVEQPHRLVYNLSVLHEPLLWDKPPFEVSWELEQMGEACRLRVTQHDYGGNPEGTRTGWSVVLSAIKTYLETGEPLSIEGPRGQSHDHH